MLETQERKELINDCGITIVRSKDGMCLDLYFSASDTMCLWGRPVAGSKALASACAWVAAVA